MLLAQNLSVNAEEQTEAFCLFVSRTCLAVGYWDHCSNSKTKKNNWLDGHQIKTYNSKIKKGIWNVNTAEFLPINVTLQFKALCQKAEIKREDIFSVSLRSMYAWWFQEVAGKNIPVCNV